MLSVRTTFEDLPPRVIIHILTFHNHKIGVGSSVYCAIPFYDVFGCFKKDIFRNVWFTKTSLTIDCRVDFSGVSVCKAKLRSVKLQFCSSDAFTRLIYHSPEMYLLMRLEITSSVSEIKLGQLFSASDTVYPSLERLVLRLYEDDYNPWTKWRGWRKIVQLDLSTRNNTEPVRIPVSVCNQLYELKKLDIRSVIFAGSEGDIALLDTPFLRHCSLHRCDNVTFSKNVGKKLKVLTCYLNELRAIENIYPNLRELEYLELFYFTNVMMDDERKHVNKWLLNTELNQFLRLKALHLQVSLWSSSQRSSFGKSIEEVRIFDCLDLYDDSVFYYDYPNLQRLQLFNSPIIFNENSQKWGFTANLKYLDIGCLENITDYFFQINSFPNLSVFILTFCVPMSGQHWQPFPNLQSLQVVNRDQCCGDEFFCNVRTPRLKKLLLMDFESGDLLGTNWGETKNFDQLGSIEVFGLGSFCDSLFVKNEFPGLTRVVINAFSIIGGAAATSSKHWKCAQRIKTLEILHCYELKDSFFHNNKILSTSTAVEDESDKKNVVFENLESLELVFCLELKGENWSVMPNLRKLLIKGGQNFDKEKFLREKPFREGCYVVIE